MTKEEKKDEMKNRISMALKDPILQQGFEIICNENEQIEHLREERNYFQEKCEDIELNYYCDHKGGCKVQELERENRLLGERCNQLLKDKGELTDKIADIKANCDLAIEGRDIKIKELETENAELKEKIEVLECDNYNANCNLNLITDHLTKATEIIKRLKSLIEDVCDINYLSKNNTKLLEETEQFLNSEVEK